MSLSNKIKMLLSVFDFAKTKDTKVLMRETDYKRFYQACSYTVGINNDITGNHAEKTVDLVCHDYKTACEKSYLSLDYNPTYGGYILERFTNGSGGVNHDFISYRLSAAKLHHALEFYLKGFYAGTVQHLKISKFK